MTRTGQSSLHSKLVDVRSALAGQIKKGAENSRLKYAFVEATTVGRQMLEELGKQRLTMLPVSMEPLKVLESISGKQWVVSVRGRWRITDADTGEFIEVEAIGMGADMADKGYPKAQTNSMKYAILMVLQAVGDDPEGDPATDDANGETARSTSGRRSTRSGTGRGRGTARPQAEDDDGDGAVSDKKDMASSAMKAKVRSKQHEVNLEDAQLKALAYQATGKESSRDWTVQDVDKILNRLDRPEIVDTFRDMDEYKPAEGEGDE